MFSIYPIANEGVLSASCYNLGRNRDLPTLTHFYKYILDPGLLHKLKYSPPQYWTLPHRLESWNITRLMCGTWLCKTQRCQLHPTRLLKLWDISCCRRIFPSSHLIWVANNCHVTTMRSSIAPTGMCEVTSRNASTFFIHVGFMCLFLKSSDSFIHFWKMVVTHSPRKLRVLSLASMNNFHQFQRGQNK